MACDQSLVHHDSDAYTDDVPRGVVCGRVVIWRGPCHCRANTAAGGQNLLDIWAVPPWNAFGESGESREPAGFSDDGDGSDDDAAFSGDNLAASGEPDAPAPDSV